MNKTDYNLIPTTLNQLKPHPNDTNYSTPGEYQAALSLWDSIVLAFANDLPDHHEGFDRKQFLDFCALGGD